MKKTLNLFTIPSWLPNIIPPEIWSIIFYWKWFLEINDIHKELINKIPKENGYIESWIYAKGIEDRYKSGDSWGTDIMYVADGYTMVKPRCGIEILSGVLYSYNKDGTKNKIYFPRYWRSDIERNRGIGDLQNGLLNNHDINCSEKFLEFIN